MSNIRYSTAKNSLILETPDSLSRTIDFKFPIVETVATGTLILVRLEPPVGTIFNENVFAVNDHGDVLWKVPKVSHVYEDSPYTSLSVSGEKVHLSNWDGLNLVVGLRSGQIISKDYGK